MKKMMLFLFLQLLICSYANAYAKAFIQPEVTVNIRTILQSPSGVSYSTGFSIDNSSMLDPNDPARGGMFDNSSILTHLHGENWGHPGNNSISSTDINIFHDSEAPYTTYCILHVQLDSDTSKLLSVYWIKNSSYQPYDKTLKPASCSYTITGQTININISN